MDAGPVFQGLTVVRQVITVIHAHSPINGLETLPLSVTATRVMSHGMVSVHIVSLVNTNPQFLMSHAHNVGHIRLRMFQGVEWQQANSIVSANLDTLHPPATQIRRVLHALVENIKSFHSVASHARTAPWVEQQSQRQVHTTGIVSQMLDTMK